MRSTARALGGRTPARGAPGGRRARTAVALIGLLGLAACVGPAADPAPTSAGSAAGAPTSGPGGPAAGPSGASPAPTGPTGQTGPTADPSATATGCATATAARLTRAERIGQLFMVGLYAARPAALDGVLTARHVGSVIYLGGWSGGARSMAAVSARLQRLAPGPADLLIAADQEGGTVQQLTGPGFTTLPSARSLGARGPRAVREAGAAIASELAVAGVSVDLAPVADTVPPELLRVNAPVGRLAREFGTDPGTVSAAVTAFVDGLQGGGRVAAAVKHFPGLGRVTGNTDHTAGGITDPLADAEDPFLAPFQAGIDAGVGMVMVSTARYPRLDPADQAVFSRAIVTGLLRERMGYAGVVVTDDVGAAQAVAAIPAADRAVRFLAAGGDLVLTADATLVGRMADAVAARAATDPGFAAAVDASAERVLALKERLGLLRCGG